MFVFIAAALWVLRLRRVLYDFAIACPKGDSSALATMRSSKGKDQVRHVVTV